MLKKVAVCTAKKLIKNKITGKKTLINILPVHATKILYYNSRIKLRNKLK